MLEKIKPLRQGNFGSVWLERDVVMNELRAVKYIDPSQLPANLDGWSREARAMSEGEGEKHIVHIYGAELTPSGPTIVMEYLAGGSAADRWAGGPAPVGEVIDAAAAACRGIERLHERGVLHRDIKPANILYSDDGVVKVSDFGLARPVGQVPSADTVNYVRHEAPELQAGSAETEVSDVYAMGVPCTGCCVAMPRFPACFPTRYSRLRPRVRTHPAMPSPPTCHPRFARS
jgi:serine/threonine protein kinase